MKSREIKYKELLKELNDGIISTEIPLVDLVKKAITKEKYLESVKILIQNYFGDDYSVKVKIRDYITKLEYNKVINMKNEKEL